MLQGQPHENGAGTIQFVIEEGLPFDSIFREGPECGDHDIRRTNAYRGDRLSGPFRFRMDPNRQISVGTGWSRGSGLVSGQSAQSGCRPRGGPDQPDTRDSMGQAISASDLVCWGSPLVDLFGGRSPFGPLVHALAFGVPRIRFFI